MANSTSLKQTATDSEGNSDGHRRRKPGADPEGVVWGGAVFANNPGFWYLTQPGWVFPGFLVFYPGCTRVLPGGFLYKTQVNMR